MCLHLHKELFPDDFIGFFIYVKFLLYIVEKLVFTGNFEGEC